MNERIEWYDNKELFEMIQNLGNEMARTRDIISKYNNLHEKIQEHDDYIKTQLGRGKGMKSVESAILQWGGWIVGVLSIIYTIYKWWTMVGG